MNDFDINVKKSNNWRNVRKQAPISLITCGRSMFISKERHVNSFYAEYAGGGTKYQSKGKVKQSESDLNQGGSFRNSFQIKETQPRVVNCFNPYARNRDKKRKPLIDSKYVLFDKQTTVTGKFASKNALGMDNRREYLSKGKMISNLSVQDNGEGVSFRNKRNNPSVLNSMNNLSVIIQPRKAPKAISIPNRHSDNKNTNLTESSISNLPTLPTESDDRKSVLPMKTEKDKQNEGDTKKTMLKERLSIAIAKMPKLKMNLKKLTEENNHIGKINTKSMQRKGNLNDNLTEANQAIKREKNSISKPKEDSRSTPYDIEEHLTNGIASILRLNNETNNFEEKYDPFDDITSVIKEINFNQANFNKELCIFSNDNDDYAVFSNKFNTNYNKAFLKKRGIIKQKNSLEVNN